MSTGDNSLVSNKTIVKLWSSSQLSLNNQLFPSSFIIVSRYCRQAIQSNSQRELGSHISNSLLFCLGIADKGEDAGKLDISCVAVEGCKAPLTREAAAEVMAAAGDFAEGPELEAGVDTWHYDHLKN